MARGFGLRCSAASIYRENWKTLNNKSLWPFPLYKANEMALRKSSTFGTYVTSDVTRVDLFGVLRFQRHTRGEFVDCSWYSLVIHIEYEN